MLNCVNAAQWRKNGMMEVGEGRVVGDLRECGCCCEQINSWVKNYCTLLAAVRDLHPS